MIKLRRLSALLLAVPVVLAGCGGGDVISGTGTSASQSGENPSASNSAPSGTSDPSTSEPSTSAPSTTSSAPSGTSAPIVSLQRVSSGLTTVALDPAFVSALQSLKVTPGVSGTTKIASSGFLLPATGGNVVIYAPGGPQLVDGEVMHDGGGLTLAAGGNTLSLTNLTFDFAAARVRGALTLNGKSVSSSVSLFDVDTAGARGTGTSGTASVSGVVVKVSSLLAAVLNRVFAVSSFTRTLVVGTASMSLTGS